ncbi:chemotaxis protein CheB [Nitrospira sp.]|nr:chemotaxis protein CheB [Nitrospira sp.]
MSTTEQDTAAVVIGGSMGAVTVLGQLLPCLPAGYGVPVFVVVHVSVHRPPGLAELFRSTCAVSVKEAEDKEDIASGTVYVAPADYHLLVEKTGILSLSIDDPVSFARPAIDVLFESAADAYGDRLVAVILTGANRDGAEGVRAVHAAGGRVLVQSPTSAESPIMPESALAACPEAWAMSVSGIAESLVSYGVSRDATRRD